MCIILPINVTCIVDGDVYRALIDFVNAICYGYIVVSTRCGTGYVVIGNVRSVSGSGGKCYFENVFNIGVTIYKCVFRYRIGQGNYIIAIVGRFINRIYGNRLLAMV